VSPGSPVGEHPPRKETQKSTHARRRPGGDAPSETHEWCDRNFTCPRQRPRGKTHASPSYPVHSPQILRKPPLRHPQRTIGKPSSDTLKGPSENPPLEWRLAGSLWRRHVAHGRRLSGRSPTLLHACASCLRRVERSLLSMCLLAAICPGSRRSGLQYGPEERLG